MKKLCSHSLFYTLCYLLLLTPEAFSDSEWFAGKLHYEYQESNRTISEENSVDQRYQSIYREGNGMLQLFAIFLDGRYFGYNYLSKTSTEQRDFSDTQSHGIGIIPIGFNMFIANRLFDDKVELDYESKTSTYTFEEFENRGINIQGFGWVGEKWRFGIYPSGKLDYKYNLDIEKQEIIKEDIQYSVHLYELVKTPSFEEEEGFWAGSFVYSKSQEAQDERSGDFYSYSYNLKAGFKLSEKSRVYAEAHASREYLESTLESNGEDLELEIQENRSVIGLIYGLMDERSLFIERTTLNETKDLTNLSYGSIRKKQRNSVAVGINLYDNIILQLKYAQTIYERENKETILYQGSSYQIKDDMVGLSLKFRFLV